jgi:Tol biopolymer transport system component
MSLIGCLVLALPGCGPDAGSATPAGSPSTSPEATRARDLEPLEGKIAFDRYSVDGGIYVVNEGGGKPRRILDSEGHVSGRAAWSPDGTRIAFHGFFGKASGEPGGLFVMNDDGSHIELLVLDGAEPAWSPTGADIAYWDGQSGWLSILNLRSGERRVLTDEIQGEDPAWSPDGRKIAFSESGRGGIFVIDADGSHLRRLVAPNPLPDDPEWSSEPSDPQWSPDGAWLAFTSYFGPQRSHSDGSTINLIHADGSNERVLTEGASPSWSPHGERVAFSSARNGGLHIFTIAIDGRDLEQITFGDAADHDPSWRPVPSR